MKNIERIRGMPADELAKFLVVTGEESDCDYDIDDNKTIDIMPCFYTPLGKYPGWWSEGEVVNEVTSWLESEEWERSD